MRDFHGLPMEPGVSKCLLYDSPAAPRFMQMYFNLIAMVLSHCHYNLFGLKVP